MVVRLRLARHGTRNNPFYHIVAIRDKAAREARPIEKLGEYDPIPRPRTTPTLSAASSSQRVLSSGLEEHKAVLEKRIEWNASRVQYWLSVGAQPSKPVAKLLDKAGLIPEGKTYKGVYRPTAPSNSSSTATATASPSAILHAATGKRGSSQSGSVSSFTGTAATALSQGETVGQPGKTDAAQEARKTGPGEATIDQAA